MVALKLLGETPVACLKNLAKLVGSLKYLALILDGAYVISDGVIAPNSSIPDHYHKWEDQTFHVLEGRLEAKIGDKVVTLEAGDSVHCPRGISHYMKNTGETSARLLSYIFPGHQAEDFMAETSRQNNRGEVDLKLIEEKFGVVYLK